MYERIVLPNGAGLPSIRGLMCRNRDGMLAPLPLFDNPVRVIAVVHSYGHQAQKWKNPIGQIQGHRTGTFFSIMKGHENYGQPDILGYPSRQKEPVRPPEKQKG